jgi:hypothetical protein
VLKNLLRGSDGLTATQAAQRRCCSSPGRKPRVAAIGASVLKSFLRGSDGFNRNPSRAAAVLF